MKLNIFEKKFRNVEVANKEYEQLEGIKYGDKLFNDYIERNTVSNELKYLDVMNFFH